MLVDERREAVTVGQSEIGGPGEERQCVVHEVALAAERRFLRERLRMLGADSFMDVIGLPFWKSLSSSDEANAGSTRNLSASSKIRVVGRC